MVSECCEKNGDGTDVVAIEIEYYTWENLEDIEPDLSTEVVMGRLNSKNWVEVCEALNSLRRIAKFRFSEAPSHLNGIVPLLAKSLKSPRSALLKSSLMAISDLFSVFKDYLLPSLDEILLPLLLKASQDKKFVADEAEKALTSMALSISPIPLLHKLQPHTLNKNPKVRAKAAVCVFQSASRLGSEGIHEIGLPFLLKLAGGQVSDHLPEAREASRKLLLELYKVFSESVVEEDIPKLKEKWEEICRKELSATVSQSVLRITV